VPESFNLAEVAGALANTQFAGNLHHLASVGSTNALALEAAQAGAPHGSVWIADEQTAGRGRGGHTWLSTPGDGLYVSVLLRPQMTIANALWLSLATGLAAQEAISTVANIRPDIRWPNDLLIGNRKFGGILVETSTTPAQSTTPAMLRHAVIGVGLNLNHQSFPPELTSLATSLRQETGKIWPREPILTAFLRLLNQQIALLEEELTGIRSSSSLLERFSAASSWVRGRRVSVDESGGYTGVTNGLDERGFLLVTGDDGTTHTVLSGGVRAQ
jgi:BirA family biotin operon repressor/biotin-[acetyl-CoA-carboxylase] ligase